jgi:lipopolysaccharide export system protein LptC
MGRHSLWLPLVLMLFLAAVSAWLNYTVQHTVNADALHETDPESIIENFQAVRTDVQGRIKERLSGVRLSHFSGSEISDLLKPHLVQITPGMADLSVISGHATISHNNNEIVLDQNVVATRAASLNNSAMVLRTERLLVYPQTNQARSPGAVSLSGGGLSVNANSLVADGNYRTLNFSGRVRSHYLASGNPHAHAQH